MNSPISRPLGSVHAFLALVGLAAALPAEAAYKITIIDFPGGQCTQLWAINDNGDVVGTAASNADCSGQVISFIYHLKDGTFTVLPTVPGAPSTAGLGINRTGVVVGGATGATETSETGFILEDGAFTFFSYPYQAFTEARGIGGTGLVTGYTSDAAGTECIPFIFDPAQNSFTTITIPGSHCLTLAQGINGSEQIVGSAVLDAGFAYSGAPAGVYGFSRNKSGALTWFTVNGGATSARGINSSGRITGYYRDSATNVSKGFVATLARSPAYQALTVPASSVLEIPSGTATFPEGIDGSGRIAGSWVEDGTGYLHGFVAAPLSKKK